MYFLWKHNICFTTITYHLPGNMPILDAELATALFDKTGLMPKQLQYLQS